MTSPLTRVLIADRAGPWRDELVESLADANAAVEVTDDGRELARALGDRADGPEVCILGQDLTHLGALDALYVAHAAEQAASRKKPGGDRAIFLVTDIRSDVELLDLLRRRGVTSFIYRDDPLQVTADRLRAKTFRDRRKTVRYATRADAVLTAGDATIRGTIEDLSTAGTQVMVPRRRVSTELAQGMDARVAFVIGPVRVECAAVVRQLALRKALLGDKLIVGLEFQPTDAESREAIHAAVRRVVLELAVQGSVNPEDEEIR